jgi:tRNA(fMet)-specific endonuclease VapC
MNGRFLLDTNIVIGILEEDSLIAHRLDPSMAIYLAAIVMGELFYGACNSGRVQQNLQRLAALAKTLPVLPCDLETAETYGRMKTELRKKGRPLPDNDIWIAAISQQKHLTLITRDKHFMEFESLSAQIW